MNLFFSSFARSCPCGHGHDSRSFRQSKGEEETAIKNKLSTLIEPVKHLPEHYLDQAIESLEKMKEEAEREEESKKPECPHCRGGSVARNGHRNICVCAAVERGRKAYPERCAEGYLTRRKILGAFSGKVCGDALLVCDGAKSYRVLEEKKVCATAVTGTGVFIRINEVNGYHSFITEFNFHQGCVKISRELSNSNKLIGHNSRRWRFDIDLSCFIF